MEIEGVVTRLRFHPQFSVEIVPEYGKGVPDASLLFSTGDAVRISHEPPCREALNDSEAVLESPDIAYLIARLYKNKRLLDDGENHMVSARLMADISALTEILEDG
jgi:hypothetical protein